MPEPTPPPEVTFLLCVEAGRLEPQALLLVRSIRRFAGTLADAPVLAFSPREGLAPGEATRAALADLGVTHIDEPLNRDHADYPMANKFAACTWAEEHATTPLLAFVDSDTIFTADPHRLRLPPEVDLAMRPVDRKDKGSTGPGDPQEPYWDELYRLTGVEARPFVDTGVDHQRIRAYGNAGLIVARRSAGVFAEWYRDFQTLRGAGHVPEQGLTYMDQLSMGAVLARRWDRVSILDWRYNYPLPLRPALAEPARSAALEELVHVHYHRWFARPGFLDAVVPPLRAASPVRAFVEPWLPFEPLIKGLPQEFRAAAATPAATPAGRGPSGVRGILRRVRGR